jgi:hypothetical protein
MSVGFLIYFLHTYVSVSRILSMLEGFFKSPKPQRIECIIFGKNIFSEIKRVCSCSSEVLSLLTIFLKCFIWHKS